MSDYPATTLALNKGKYYVLLTIPADLREHFNGRKQLKKSTGTSDLADARRKQHGISSELYAMLDAAKPDIRDVLSDYLGWIPKLSIKMIGVQLNDHQRALHDEVVELRNKVVAHSDAALMRMVVKLGQLDIGNGETMPFFDPAFDEGLDFVGNRVVELLELFHTIYSGLFTTLIKDARENPDKFDVHLDWLPPR